MPPGLGWCVRRTDGGTVWDGLAECALSCAYLCVRACVRAAGSGGGQGAVLGGARGPEGTAATGLEAVQVA